MTVSRRNLPLVAAAVAGLLLIVLLRNLFSADADPPGNPIGARDRGRCVQLSLVGSSDKAGVLKEIAGDYERAGRLVDGECVAVNVSSKGSGPAVEALVRGWDEAVDGPRPDVWSPTASSWVGILRQRLIERDAPGIVPDALPHIAESPLVIAMPRPMAQAMGWPDQPIGWADILTLAKDPAGWGKLGHPEWGRFRLGKTNPNFSTAGFNATIAAYFAATGRSTDLVEADIADPKVVDFVKGVESSVLHYGDTSLTFLRNLQKADDAGLGLTYISAVTLEEKAVWDYNQGNPGGDPARAGKHPRPKTPLVAIYPKEGTLLWDHPYTVLNAPWVDEAKKRAAADFLEFVQSPGPQKHLQSKAYRSYKGDPGDAVRPSNGLLASEPKIVIDPPAPAVLDLIQRSWKEVRKRARVLLVVDVSGSMGQAVPSSGASRLDLAKQAAIKALDQFASDDEVGLWIFSSDLAGDKPFVELMPPSPVGPKAAELKWKIESLVPRGGTALYTTVRAATRELGEEFDPSRINGIVLLSDGRNEYPADTDLQGLLRELRSEGEETRVRVFPIAYGEDADLKVLSQIAEASRAAAYDAADPTSIDQVLTQVVSNF